MTLFLCDVGNLSTRMNKNKGLGIERYIKNGLSKFHRERLKEVIRKDTFFNQTSNWIVIKKGV